MRIFSESEHYGDDAGAAEAERERVGANLASVRSVLAISSVKGGTGKSVLAVNMAAALARTGKKVAIVDADFNAPSILAMLGVKASRCFRVAEMIEPATGPFGLRVVSGDCLPEGEAPPISFVGEEPEVPANHIPPVVELSPSAALRRVLGQTRFGQLDLLIIDLAPGLDQLHRLSRTMKVGGVLLVSRPSASAARHLRQALEMAARTGVPVLGIAENMVGFACEICHSVKPLFPEGENLRVAREASVEIIARLPFDPRLAECSDRGTLFVHEFPETPVTKQILEAARHVEALVISRAQTPRTKGEAMPSAGAPSPAEVAPSAKSAPSSTEQAQSTSPPYSSH